MLYTIIGFIFLISIYVISVTLLAFGNFIFIKFRYVIAVIFGIPVTAKLESIHRKSIFWIYYLSFEDQNQKTIKLPIYGEYIFLKKGKPSSFGKMHIGDEEPAYYIRKNIWISEKIISPTGAKESFKHSVKVVALLVFLLMLPISIPLNNLMKEHEISFSEAMYLFGNQVTITLGRNITIEEIALEFSAEKCLKNPSHKLCDKQ